MSACVISLDPRDFIPWARAIARGVRADYRFGTGSQEELELEGTALEQLVASAARFDESRLRPGDDPAALFRAMAAPWVRKACKREAERLRNGGLYRTAARARLTVVPLPVSRCEDCTEVMLAARELETFEDEAEGREPDPLTCTFEPRLEVWRSDRTA
jgi:hypothetical protein